MPAKALVPTIRWVRDKNEENETGVIDWQMELLLSAKKNNGVASLAGLRRRTLVLGERSVLTAR